MNKKELRFTKGKLTLENKSYKKYVHNVYLQNDKILDLCTKNNIVTETEIEK